MKINLPLIENTVVAVEQAIKDRYNYSIKSPVYWLTYLGDISPSTEEKLEFLNAMQEYAPDKD